MTSSWSCDVNPSGGGSEATVAGTALSVFRQLDGWSDAIRSLQELHDGAGEHARREADRFAARFEGQRAAMILDVVYSANRRYDTRVVPRVEAFQLTPAAQSLRSLAEQGVGDTTGFRRYEASSIRDLARSFAEYADRGGLDDDAACRQWAQAADPGVVYGLDPVIGRVKGIGLALYRYLRMRCGADDLKPDRRVANALSRLGFPRVHGSEAIYALGMAAALDSGIRPLELDQLLWFDG